MAQRKKSNKSFNRVYYHPWEIWWKQFSHGFRIIVFMVGLFGAFHFFTSAAEEERIENDLNRSILPDDQIDFEPEQPEEPEAPPGDKKLTKVETYDEKLERMASEVIEYPADYVYDESHELDYNGNTKTPDWNGTVAYGAVDSTDY